MNTSKPYKKVLYNTSLLTVMQVTGDSTGLILYVVLSRYFGPEGIGLYAFGMSIALIAFYFINSGFDDYGIRECSLIPQIERNILIGKIVVVQLLLLMVTLIIFIPFIFAAKLQVESIIIVSSILINMILLAFSKTFFISFNSQERMVLPALAELSMKILNVATASIAIIFFKTQIYIALLPYVLFGILILVLAVFSSRKINGKLNLNFKLNSSISLIKTVWPFSASLMIHSLYTRVGVIILTLLLGSTAAGIFAPAQKFLEVAQMPIVFFGFSVYPVLSKYYKHNIEKFNDSVEKFFRLVFIIASILLWILYYIVPLLIVPILGGKFTPSIEIIKLFAFLIFFGSFTVGFHKLLLSANLQVLRTKAQFLALIVNLIASFSLIPLLGTKGAVISLIISDVTMNFLFIYILKKKSFLLFKKLVKAFGQFLISFLIAIFAAIALKYLTISDLYGMLAVFLLFAFGIYATGFISKLNVKFNNPMNMITK